MPIEKHPDTHLHYIKLPPLLPYDSSQLGKPSTRVSHHESPIEVKHGASNTLPRQHNLLK